MEFRVLVSEGTPITSEEELFLFAYFALRIGLTITKIIKEKKLAYILFLMLLTMRSVLKMSKLILSKKLISKKYFLVFFGLFSKFASF